MSDQLSDKLVEIPSSEWTTLRDMYLRDWPTHMMGYNTVDNYVRWNNHKSDIKHLHIYSLNGAWRQDGTFVLVDRYQVFVNTLNNDSIERISTALMLIDWKYGLQFGSLLCRHWPAVLQAVHSKQLTLAYKHKAAIYFMSRSEAADLDIVCPKGISLRSLSQEHAVIINKLSHDKRPDLLYLKRLIDWNLNVGAFTDDGKLVSWCLRSPTGTLKSIQVDPDYLRRGLGTLVIKAMVKKLSDLDMDTYAPVFVDNVASRRMFEKIGFKTVDYCGVLGTNPLTESDWKDLETT